MSGDTTILSALLSPTVIISIVGGLVAVFTIITMILSYHWKKYSITKDEGRRIKVVYYFVSTFLWVVVILSAIQVLTETSA